MTKVAVIYYSATGNVHALAEAVAEGAMEAGAQVRLRRVAELAPADAIDSNLAWRAHVDATADIQVATNDDVLWADGLAFGSPTRFGNVSSQLKRGNAACEGTREMRGVASRATSRTEALGSPFAEELRSACHCSRPWSV